MFNVLENSLWTEKYRPTNLDGYICTSETLDCFQRYLDDGEVPHLLFHGRAGNGKTTISKILAQGIDSDILYINASDENSVDTIRNKIKSFVSSVGFKRWKIVILDEADHITPNGQAALRNIMETFSKSSRFILTCNYPEKIIDPIKSRCTIFELHPPEKKDVAIKMAEMLKVENIEFSPKDIVSTVNANYPDIRRIVTALQQQIQDDKLVLLEKTTIELDYQMKILAELKSSKNDKSKYSAIRKHIANSKLRSFEGMYRFLFDNLEEFAKEGSRAKVIIAIGESMKDDAFCVDKEIHIIALLIKLIDIIN